MLTQMASTGSATLKGPSRNRFQVCALSSYVYAEQNADAAPAVPLPSSLVTSSSTQVYILQAKGGASACLSG